MTIPINHPTRHITMTEIRPGHYQVCDRELILFVIVTETHDKAAARALVLVDECKIVGGYLYPPVAPGVYHPSGYNKVPLQ